MRSHLALLPAVLVALAATIHALPNTAHHHRHASTFLHRREDEFNIANTPPSKDPFYTVPMNISQYSQGSIIRSRKMPDTTSIFGSDAGDTYQLLFRTNSVHLKPDAAVTTVIAPKKPAKGNAKIVAVSSPEDSPAVDCALSWALVPHTKSDEDFVGGNGGFTIAVKAALFLGYYVTTPDQEGSKAGWLAYSEGQVMLDSILAIVNHKDTIANSTGYQAALTGYSGGGHGAAWAGHLASTYGREISIVALAAGGIPVDPLASLQYLDGKLESGLVYAGLAGFGNVYPKYNEYLQSILKPKGIKAFEKLRDGSWCIIKSLLHMAYRSIHDDVSDPDFMNSTISKEVLDENFLGKHQNAITDFPVYQVHSQIDDQVIYGPAYSYFQSQCSKGAKIILTNPVKGRHTYHASISLPSFFYFIKEAFEGTLKVPHCRQSTEYLIPYDGPEAVATVGQKIVNDVKMHERLFKVADLASSL